MTAVLPRTGGSVAVDHTADPAVLRRPPDVEVRFRDAQAEGSAPMRG